MVGTICVNSKQLFVCDKHVSNLQHSEIMINNLAFAALDFFF